MSYNILKPICVYVTSTQNNTHICFTINSKVIFKTSAGCFEKVKSKRASAVAAQRAAEEGADYILKNYKEYNLFVFLKGFGKGRNSVIKGFLSRRMHIDYVWQINSIPFNGCKARKKRRL